MDDKKRDLLERSAGVFLRMGIKSVTMDDLCRELGISKKTIYKYFNDKNELVKEIIQSKVDLDCAIVCNFHKKGQNAIDDLFTISEFLTEQLKNVTPSIFFDLKKYHPEAWAILEQHKWNFVRNAIKENIERGIEEGLYRKSVDPEVLSTLHVSNTDLFMNTTLFPWPQYKFQDVYLQITYQHLFGLANSAGREYLKQKIKAEYND